MIISSVLVKYQLAGVPGLEPRLNEPESLVLPITPYPNDSVRFFRSNGENTSSMTACSANLILVRQW